MELYSYKGKKPTKLPFRIRLDNGSTRTSLSELNVEELESLGFVGPITKPEFNEDTQRIEWTGSLYEIIELTEEEIAQKIADKEAEEYLQKLENIDYNRFWELLITSGIYKKLRASASQSLTANTLCTELIALFGDAKAGKANIRLIQKYMNILFLNFEFTLEEIEELQGFMNDTNLNVIYTLPDEEYLSTHTYNSELNKIIDPAPFESWVLVDGNWEAPVPHPNDEKNYYWNEEIGNWTEVNL